VSEDKINLSIHPRSWPSPFGRGRDKSSTSKKHDKGVLEKKIASITAHNDRHPKDAASEVHAQKMKARL
jgi:ribosomal protein S15P/S13E